MVDASPACWIPLQPIVLPLLADPEARPRETIYAEQFTPNGFNPSEQDNRTVRDHRWKLIRNGNTDAFYDLEGQLFEQDDLLEGQLTPTQQAALDNLRFVMDSIRP